MTIIDPITEAIVRAYQRGLESHCQTPILTAEEADEETTNELWTFVMEDTPTANTFQSPRANRRPKMMPAHD